MFDSVVPGLAIRVNVRGIKSWVLFYRKGGRLRRWTLGNYPTPLGLAAARKKAAGAKIALDDKGIDPGAVKREGRAAGDTFKDLADAYMKVAIEQKRSSAEDQRIIDSELLPHWKYPQGP